MLSLVFRVYYERPMVSGSLNLKLRQIARFSSNMILDEMSSAKCHLLFGFFLIAQHEERPLYHIHVVTSRSDIYLTLFLVRNIKYELTTCKCKLVNYANPHFCAFYPVQKGTNCLLHFKTSFRTYKLMHCVYIISKAFLSSMSCIPNWNPLSLFYPRSYLCCGL